MKHSTIAKLLKCIPDKLLGEFVFGKHNSGALKAALTASGNEHDCHRFSILYSLTDFAWRFAGISAKHDIPIPGFVAESDEILWRAYLYNVNPRTYRDQHIIAAMELNHDRSGDMAGKLKALLMARDSSPSLVARHCGLHERTVRCYEQLFFNVYDRRDEALYVSRILYPDGRVSEFLPDYIDRVPHGTLMMRGAHNNGIRDALHMAGMTNTLGDAMSSAQSAKDLEGVLMATGYLMAKNGWINADNAGSLMHARQLIAAGKIGGQDNSGAASELSYMGDVYWRELKRYKTIDMENALRFRNGIELAAPSEAPQTSDTTQP